MYYLYNPSRLTYICKDKRGVFGYTRKFNHAYMFDEEFTPANILNSKNLPKVIPDREGYIVMRCDNGTKKPPVLSVPTELEINKKATFSLDELEQQIKQNNRKIKTVYTYMKNVYESVKTMEETLNLIDNKVVLIYHYIESGECVTEEEKAKVNDLLNRILLIRRDLKRQRAVYAEMTASSTLNKLEIVKNKLKPFEYWTYPSVDSFINFIENGSEVVK